MTRIAKLALIGSLGALALGATAAKADEHYTQPIARTVALNDCGPSYGNGYGYGRIDMRRGEVERLRRERLARERHERMERMRREHERHEHDRF
jgi:hypothetical protein